MADLATLGLAIDSRPAVDAATALGNFREAAGGAQTAAQALQATVGRAGGSLAQATAGVREATSAHRDLAAQIGATATNLGNYVVRQGDATRAVNDTTSALARQAAGWRALGEAGRSAVQMYDRNVEASRRLGSLSSTGTVPQIAAQGATSTGGRLNANGLQNLFYQGTDVIASAASGMSPLTIALQQGGQIAPTFMGPNGASIGGIASQAGEALGGLAGRIGVAGGALGLLTVAVGTAAAAALSYRSAQDALKLQLAGTGRASGATIAGINADAALNAGAAGLSQREYREASGAFAATGRIGQEMYAGLLKSAKDFAYTTGQDVPEAIKDLAGAFADPAKGAQSLNERLGFLNDTTLESIQRLQAQGDRLGAQRVLMDSYSTSLLKVKDATSAWSQATTAAGNFVADIWDRIGAATNRSFTGGNSLEEQLTTAKDLLSTAKGFQGGIVDQMFGNASSEVDRLQKVINAIQQMIAARDRANQQTAANQNSLIIGNLTRSLDPSRQELKKTEDAAEALRKAIADPIKWGLDLTQLATAEQAFERVSRLARTTAEDIARFGSTATADMVRGAEFGNRTATYTPQARGAAEAQRTYETELRKRGLDATGPTSTQVRTDYEGRIGNADSREIASLVGAREEALRNAVEREALQRVRDETISGLNKQTTAGLNVSGGAFARMPGAIQQQILDLSQRPEYARIPPEIVAAIARAESSGNPNVGFSRQLGENGRPSSAYGLGQITAGTAADAARQGYLPPGYDRTNPDTMVQGIFGVLAMKMGQTGSLDQAIMSYRGSANQSVNQQYLAGVMRNAGRLGDASEQAGALQVDTARRAAEAAGQQLQNVTQNYGRNTVALEANQRATDQVNAAIAAGRQVTGDFTASIRAYETAAAQAARQTKIVQAGVDMAFDEAQLGRSSREQAGYARARSLLGETTSPEAQAIASRTIEYNDLREAKGTLTDAATGFASDLRRGASAADAAANALNRISDKVIGSAIDSLISSAFKQSGGGGGIGGLLGSIFGGGSGSGSGGIDVGATSWMPKFSSGGYTGPGGIYEPRGVVHAGEVVWSQVDVARAGGPLVVDAMRLGKRGYAEGGYVGAGAYPMPARPAANSNGSAMPTINFITQPGTNLEPDGPPQRRADGSYDQVLRTVESGLANRARNGRGPLQQAAGGAWARTG